MANVDQFEAETALVEQRSGLMAAPAAALAKIRETLDQPGFRRAFPTLLASLTAVAAVILYISMQKPEMTTLYSSVSESEKSRIIDSLKNMGVEVQLDPVTGEILVPTECITKLEYLWLHRDCQNTVEMVLNPLIICR